MKPPARRTSGSTPGALSEYLLEQIGKVERLPKEPLTGKHGSERDAVEWALAWAPDLPAFIAESYVNLIPTSRRRHACERPAARRGATRCASSPSSATSCRAA